MRSRDPKGSASSTSRVSCPIIGKRSIPARDYVVVVVIVGSVVCCRQADDTGGVKHIANRVVLDKLPSSGCVMKRRMRGGAVSSIVNLIRTTFV